MDEISAKNREYRSRQSEGAKQSNEIDNNYIRFRKKGTAGREMPRPTAIGSGASTANPRSKSTIDVPLDRRYDMGDDLLNDDDSGNIDQVYIKGLQKGNSNILVSVRTRPVNSKEKKYAKEKRLDEKCIKILDEKI